jgi:hypothetical protein
MNRDAPLFLGTERYRYILNNIYGHMDYFIYFLTIKYKVEHNYGKIDTWMGIIHFN